MKERLDDRQVSDPRKAHINKMLDQPTEPVGIKSIGSLQLKIFQVEIGEQNI